MKTPPFKSVVQPLPVAKVFEEPRSVKPPKYDFSKISGMIYRIVVQGYEMPTDGSLPFDFQKDVKKLREEFVRLYNASSHLEETLRRGERPLGLISALENWRKPSEVTILEERVEAAEKEAARARNTVEKQDADVRILDILTGSGTGWITAALALFAVIFTFVFTPVWLQGAVPFVGFLLLKYTFRGVPDEAEVSDFEEQPPAKK